MQIVMTRPSTDLWGDIAAVLRRLDMERNDLVWSHPAATLPKQVGNASGSVRVTTRKK
jgi:hypothetical protein